MHNSVNQLGYFRVFSFNSSFKLKRVLSFSIFAKEKETNIWTMSLIFQMFLSILPLTLIIIIIIIFAMGGGKLIERPNMLMVDT